jgi:hypothetical protein
MRVSRYAAIGLIFVLVLAAGCSKASRRTMPTPSTDSARADREFPVVLDDSGLHIPQEQRPSATYVISFTDRRSHVGSKQRVVLTVSPIGPPFTLFSLSAGTHRTEVLLANESVQVLVNDVPHRGLAASLNIAPSKEYPTPAT